jgi:hypothetical protein
MDYRRISCCHSTICINARIPGDFVRDLQECGVLGKWWSAVTSRKVQILTHLLVQKYQYCNVAGFDDSQCGRRQGHIATTIYTTIYVSSFYYMCLRYYYICVRRFRRLATWSAERAYRSGSLTISAVVFSTKLSTTFSHRYRVVWGHIESSMRTHA